MADDASRLQHLTDSSFLSHFAQTYPQPTPWRLLLLPSETASLRADLRLALSVANRANTVKTARSWDAIFSFWAQFCMPLGVSPCLRDVPDPETKLCYLLVFAIRYQATGRTGKSVQANTVQDALVAVGQGISNLGQPDPCFAPHGTNQHPVLAGFLKRLRSQDDPATRAYPASLTIIRGLYDVFKLNHTTQGRCTTMTLDLIIVAFYWLLRPCEYLHGREDGQSTPFRLCDVQFTANDTIYPATDPLLNDVEPASLTHASLTFTDQKNGVCGKRITQCATSDSLLCPIRALACITSHQRLHGTPAKTPLHSYYNNHAWHHVGYSLVTTTLCTSAAKLCHITGIDPALLSARSLRPGGATALLCANIDKDTIKLLGRWKSDAMFVYLRIQALAYHMNIAQHMQDHGSYTFAPGVYNASVPDPLPTQLPAAVATALSPAASSHA